MKNKKLILPILTFCMLFCCLVIAAPAKAEAKSVTVKSGRKVTKAKMKMRKGQKKTIKLKNVKSSKKVKWKSSNPNVVKIKNRKGKTVKIKAKKRGTATITGKIGKKKVKVKVKVKKQSVKDKAIKLLSGKWYKWSSGYVDYYYRFTKKNYVTYNADTNEILQKDAIASITYRNGEYTVRLVRGIKYVFEATNGKVDWVYHYFLNDSGEWTFSGSSSLSRTSMRR